MRLTLQPQALVRLDALLANPRGRRVGVLGLGVVGRAMASHLLKKGAQVIAADSNVATAMSVAAVLGIEVRNADVDIDALPDAEGVAVSPGVHHAQATVQQALARGVPVFGELELCGMLPARVAAITGTNGKSTTTSLTGALLEGAGQRVFVGGNLGAPVLGWIDSGDSVDTAVLELSSFQLETAYRFQADVALVLNVTPDHADRYDSFDDYVAAKRRLLENLSSRATAILNHDDPIVRRMARSTAATVWWFSTESNAFEDGVWLEGDAAHGCGAASGIGTLMLDHPRLMGRHNRANAMASLLAAHALGVADPRALRRAYLAFRGLAHRLEWIADVNGVRFINDSKATNDDAAAVAVRAMVQPTILLLGGRDKGGGYAALRSLLPGPVRHIVVYGESAPIIAKELSVLVPMSTVTNFAEAVQAAFRTAQAGDAVLLAPACASYDQFRNFEERGETFRRLVFALEGSHG